MRMMKRTTNMKSRRLNLNELMAIVHPQSPLRLKRTLPLLSQPQSYLRTRNQSPLDCRQNPQTFLQSKRRQKPKVKRLRSRKKRTPSQPTRTAWRKVPKGNTWIALRMPLHPCLNENGQTIRIRLLATFPLFPKKREDFFVDSRRKYSTRTDLTAFSYPMSYQLLSTASSIVSYMRVIQIRMALQVFDCLIFDFCYVLPSHPSLISFIFLLFSSASKASDIMCPYSVFFLHRNLRDAFSLEHLWCPEQAQSCILASHSWGFPQHSWLCS